jgi:hypothetical protein
MIDTHKILWKMLVHIHNRINKNHVQSLQTLNFISYELIIEHDCNLTLITPRVKHAILFYIFAS